MNYTHKWYIYDMKAIPLHEGKTNVITSISWEAIVWDDEQSTRSIAKVTELDLPGVDDEFIDYLELSKDQVLEWVCQKEGMTKSEFEQYLIDLLESDKAPKQTVNEMQSVALPWDMECCGNGIVSQ